MGLCIDHFIPRTPKDVWRIVTDWTIAEYWLGVNKLRPLHPKERIGVGSKLTYDVRGAPQLMTVTAWKPRQELGLESMQGGIAARYLYTFSKSEDGTRVQLEARCSADKGLWKLLAPVADWMMARSDRNQLTALGKLVEATTGGPDATRS